MYEYLIGKITAIYPAYVVLEVNGIGYQIVTMNPYRYHVDEQLVKIYVQQVIREDSHQLFGFQQLTEKNLFLQLIKVSGIGPKSALAIMAGEDHQGLIQAVEASDVTYLTKFPGVGKKTAQQMILDLKGKLDALNPEITLFTTEVVEGTTIDENQALVDALAALQALGYANKEIQKVDKALRKLPTTTTDDYLRQALKLLMKK